MYIRYRKKMSVFSLYRSVDFLMWYWTMDFSLIHLLLPTWSFLFSFMTDSATYPSGSQKWGICSVCNGELPLVLNGTLRFQSPITNQCPGSRMIPMALWEVRQYHFQPTYPQVCSAVAWVSLYIHQPFMLRTRICNFNQSWTHSWPNLKRISQASLSQAARKLTSIFDNVIISNDRESWEGLFLYLRRCLLSPEPGGRRGNLITLLNRAMEEESETHIHQPPNVHRIRTHVAYWQPRYHPNWNRVILERQLGLASLIDSFCIHDENSLESLRGKHLSALLDSNIPQF